ncbi:unnamed protein product [Spirodela intermedia]|uniref:F-box/LRR-repeat protein 15-like leucin rich repeat domain-containing protein n=1 Tax=Spirodela intermedia TaxID=51605 RepID=A0A7I8KEI5_SPIIN|nr:unnamed protein product [Spirodela intermedia]
MKAGAPPGGAEEADGVQELGFGDGLPPAGTSAPRRSARLAGRAPAAASGEPKGARMASPEGSRKKRKVAGDAAVPTSGAEEEGAVGSELNLPLMASPSGSGWGNTVRGRLEDLVVLSESGSVEKMQNRDPASSPRSIRRRVEVVDIESDAPEEEVDTSVPGRGRYSSIEKGKGIFVADYDGPLVEKGGFVPFLDRTNPGSKGLERTQQGRRYTEEQKGKRKLVTEDDAGLTLGGREANMELRCEGMADYYEQETIKEEAMSAKNIRESNKLRAVELASEYAFFKPEQEEESEHSDIQDSSKEDPADWPGPFATAMKIINDREKRLQGRRLSSAPAPSESSELKIEWVPSPGHRLRCLERQAPSLKDLCLGTLSEHATDIESLEGVPDNLRHQLSWHLCNSRKMDQHMLDLFVRGSPTEIRMPDCSWATEDQLEKILGRARTHRLTVLELNMCGRCLSDGTLSSSGKLPPRFPSLTTISLKGAYRLSDDGLKALASSAPQLSSINLGQCSLVTSAGVVSLLEQLKQSLVELFLDDCRIDATSVLPALQSLRKLEVLSVAGVESVTDKFVHGLVSVHGPHMKELGFAGCRGVAAPSLREIGKSCPQLRSLDLRDLGKLNDRALAHLAGGCTSLWRLLLRRNAFSDKAVAALLQAAGGSLAELSVNNIREASNFTAQAIAAQCASTLRVLDLSFCRKMTNEGLGLIADSCSHLHTLKLFGCPLITPTFLGGDSNGRLQVVGLEGPILRHLRFHEASS